MIVDKIFDINGECKSINVHLVLHIKKCCNLNVYRKLKNWKALKVGKPWSEGRERLLFLCNLLFERGGVKLIIRPKLGLLEISQKLDPFSAQCATQFRNGKIVINFEEKKKVLYSFLIYLIFWLAVFISSVAAAS